MLEPVPTISVIIPTYNRKESLLRTLDSLREQTFPRDRLVVIVVDDGSTDDTRTIAGQQFPFSLCYVRQENQGATAARNYGATISQAEILVFIDDDVTISPHTLEAFAEMFGQREKILVTGTLNRRSTVIPSAYTAFTLASLDYPRVDHGEADLHFIDCNTELMAIRRSDFFALGMLQDPTDGHGWPNWDDVDFGYRAHLSGFRLLLSAKAVGDHWDYSITDRIKACQRWYRASRSAVWLFNRHQELQTLIPMLYDKTPPAWGQDSPPLIARKLARSLLSSQPVFAGTEKLVSLLEKRNPSSTLLRRLYSSLQGAYMFQGYRKGLRDFKMASAEK